MKFSRHWKTFKKTPENQKTSYDPRLIDLILWKLLPYQKQSTESRNSKAILHENWRKSYILYGNPKDTRKLKQPWIIKTEESTTTPDFK